MTRNPSRFKKVQLSPRQLRDFDRLYQEGYPIPLIMERFGISANTVNDLARTRCLTKPHNRGGRRYAND